MNDLVKEVILELSQDKVSMPEMEISLLASTFGDRSMIKQVWINLLSNAIKYSSKNLTPIVKVGSHRDRESVIYSVSDNGVGFDMKYYEKLFKVFQRLHRPSDFSGTGIGLALVQRIIEKHQGRVWAEAKVNEGATFFFSIPTKGKEANH